MRPQGFGQGAAGLEDLGWNDMGFEPPKPAVTPIRDADHDGFGEEVDDQQRVHPTGLTPVHSPVHTQHAEIADRLGVDEPEEAFEELDETVEPLEIELEPAPAPTPTPVAILPTVPRRAPQLRSAPGSKAKAAFTLRLDPERHLKLRLACAVNARSAQQLVTDALDHLLGDMPELESMAAKAKRKG
jgi:tetrahydromethanopterin S-methyltransferase subunit B